MAFQFKRKESIANAVRRLGEERFDSAFKNLRQTAQLEAIHCVRKDIKKLRAILRLVRQDLPKSAYQSATGLLRQAANGLAQVRDAHVTVKALRNLVGHFARELPHQPLPHTRKALQRECQAASEQFNGQGAAKKVARLLRQLRPQLRQFKTPASGWPALAPGVRWSYRCGRQDYRLAREQPTPANLHQWRKRVKDLWYHTRLLRPLWPEQMCAMAAELKALGEYLGDDHDLVLLRQRATELCRRDGDAQELELLKALAQRRQSELQQAALALGARFYVEKPGRFCKRLGQYWQIWCREKKTRRAGQLMAPQAAKGKRPGPGAAAQTHRPALR